jgi:hypothetical protein
LASASIAVDACAKICAEASLVGSAEITEVRSAISEIAYAWAALAE